MKTYGKRGGGRWPDPGDDASHSRGKEDPIGEVLPCKHGYLNSNPRTHLKMPGSGAHACNPSTRETEMEILTFPDQPA